MKKIFFLALAGATIVACQKPGERVPQNGDTKSVSISINYASPTTRVASSYQVGHNTAVTKLTNGTLYFFNSSGLVVGTHSITDGSQTTFVIDNVSSAATSVGMIANAASDLTAGDPATFAEFKAKAMSINNQASMSGATTGTAAAPDAVQGIALLDGAGSNTGNSANALTPAPSTVTTHTHTAAITLSPAVSRIEIGPSALKVKDNGTTTPNITGLKSFKLSGFYVNNYSPTFTLGFTQATTLFGAGIQAGGNSNWVTAYTTLTPNQYLYDQLSTAADVSTTTGVGNYAYHVFPGAKMPHIIIAGNTFTYGDEVDTTTKYWLIDEFYKDNGSGGKGDPITEFLPGYVYRISGIAVGDTHPTDDPYDKPAKLQVTVTINAWQVQNTYVEPN